MSEIDYFYIEANDNFTGASYSLNFCFEIKGTLTTVPNIEYSTDKVTWTAAPFTNGYTTDFTVYQTPYIYRGPHRIYFRNTSGTWSESTSNYVMITLLNYSIGIGQAGGNIMTLLDYRVESDTVPNYAFFRMFYYHSTQSHKTGYAIRVTSDLKMPATKIGERSYASMFYMYDKTWSESLKNLMTDLPQIAEWESVGTNGADSMFYNRKGITEIPKLTALTVGNAGYYMMFYGCEKVKVSETLVPGEYEIPFRIPSEGETTGIGTNVATLMFTSTGGTFMGTPVIGTTYYLYGTMPSGSKISLGDLTATFAIGDTPVSLSLGDIQL